MFPRPGRAASYPPPPCGGSWVVNNGLGGAEYTGTAAVPPLGLPLLFPLGLPLPLREARGRGPRPLSSLNGSPPPPPPRARSISAAAVPVRDHRGDRDGRPAAAPIAVVSAVIVAFDVATPAVAAPGSPIAAPTHPHPKPYPRSPLSLLFLPLVLLLLKLSPPPHLVLLNFVPQPLVPPPPLDVAPRPPLFRYHSRSSPRLLPRRFPDAGAYAAPTAAPLIRV